MIASRSCSWLLQGERAGGTRPDDPKIPQTIQITSPLGRTGLPGTVRIVARVTTPDECRQPSAVRFYVNGTLIATDTDGPPYVAEWQDENPFEPCTLAVEADDAARQCRYATRWSWRR